MHTTNVIERIESGNLSVKSFPDDRDGNGEAESHFKASALAHGAKECDVDSFIEDGYFESGDYELYLVHSN